MIGNDIVDLELARKESNWKRKGFLNKIFTNEEQLLISNAANSEVMVWNLWSRKEAAYKIYNRETGIRGYFPFKLKCFDLEINEEITFGKVLIEDFVYFTKTEIKPDFINTIAVKNGNYLKNIKRIKNRNNIIKINGIPSYFNTNNGAISPASISHHGRFERIVSL